MNRLFAALARVAGDLDQLDAAWALIGGLAVAVRAEARTTRDVDLAVAVEDDLGAQKLVQKLFERGYAQHEILEAKPPGRLRGVRLIPPGSPSFDGVVVDLLFAISGIERELVEAATPLKLTPRLQVPVASTGHLIALKLLAWRPRDQRDARWLVSSATASDFEQTRVAIALMQRRGFGAEQVLTERLEDVLDQEPESGL